MEFVPRKPMATFKHDVLHILFCLFLERDEYMQEAVDMNHRTEFKRPTHSIKGLEGPLDRGTEKHLRKQRERQNENKAAAVRRCRQKEGNGYANIQLQIRPERSAPHWSLNQR